MPVPAADDDGATAAAATEVGASGDGGRPAAKRARLSSGAASSSAGGAVSASAAAATAPAATAATRAIARSCAAPPTLPGGYSVGDEVFYTGTSQRCGRFNRVEYGGKGEVIGPGFGADKDSCVIVMFPGNTHTHNCMNCLVTSLSRTAPSAR